MKFFRAVPFIINLYLYFGSDIEQALRYLPLTLAYFIFGNWIMLVYGIYQFFWGSDLFGVILVSLSLYLMYKAFQRKRESTQFKTSSIYDEDYDDDDEDEDFSPPHKSVTTNRIHKTKHKNSYHEDTYMAGDDAEHVRSSRKFTNKNRYDDEREQRERENDAYYYRKHGGPRWKVEAADDDLGRSQRDRDYEDDTYERICSECREAESHCKCCDNCGRHPCECCDECGEANCKCCRDCDSYPCECCRECGEANCKCCRDCDSYPCECCRECGEANCRCCYRCGRYPCECD